MIEEGIPFVIQNKQIYLPFIGIMLSEQTDRQIMPVRMISYLTQKLLLCGLYEKWVNMTVTDIAEKMHVTKMSISRCFDEIQYLGIDVLGMKGKSRVICMRPLMKDVRTGPVSPDTRIYQSWGTRVILFM